LRVNRISSQEIAVMDGKQLKEVLKSEGFMLSRVAEMMGKTKANFTNGVISRKNLKTETVEKIAELTGIPLSRLYGFNTTFSPDEYKYYFGLRAENELLKRMIEEQGRTITFLRQLIKDKIPGVNPVEAKATAKVPKKAGRKK